MDNIRKFDNHHLQLFDKENLVADIYIENGVFKIEKYDKRIGHQLFLADNIDFNIFKDIISTRVFSDKRPDLKELLEQLGLKEYDLYDIIRKTHGLMFFDYLWFKFDDENINYNDIKIR